MISSHEASPGELLISRAALGARCLLALRDGTDDLRLGRLVRAAVDELGLLSNRDGRSARRTRANYLRGQGRRRRAKTTNHATNGKG